MSRGNANPPAAAAGHRNGPQAPAATASSDMTLSLSSPKIRAWHLERKAIVYIRQSTMQQVRTRLEGQRRQYDLRERAQALGFQRVVVIDEDQGRSGTGSVERPGFGRLLAEVPAGAP